MGVAAARLDGFRIVLPRAIFSHGKRGVFRLCELLGRLEGAFPLDRDAAR